MTDQNELSQSTRRLLQIYNFIVEYKRVYNGNSPTIREIGDAAKIDSTSLIDYYLTTLDGMGLINRDGGGARNIFLPNSQWVLPEQEIANARSKICERG